MVHPDPQADSGSYLIKLLFQIVLNFIIRHADVVRAIDIKKDLQAVFLMDDAEVMVEKIRAQVLQETGELFPEKGGFFIICDNGVDVNDGLDPELAARLVSSWSASMWESRSVISDGTSRWRVIIRVPGP